MTRPPRRGTPPMLTPARLQLRRRMTLALGISPTRSGHRTTGSGMPIINRSAITSIRGSTAPWRLSAWGRPRGC